MPDAKIATLLALDEDRTPFGAMAPAIYQTSLFTFENYEDMAAAFAGTSDHFIYSRGRNPTVELFEHKVAEMEGTEAAKAFASGMGAISSAILSQVASGDRVVCVRNVYPDTYKLLTQFLPRFGVQTTFVDGTDTDAVIRALEGARVLYLENPTSLTFDLQDVRALTTAARQLGVVTVLDNSWATPVYQRPISLGVDLVVHSASKYFSGHSDVVAGVAAGSAAHVAKLSSLEYAVLGAKLSPFDAWLLVRGLRTLPLRLAQHHRNALRVAAFLEGQSKVARVRYPAAADHAQHDLFDQQFSGGSGLLSFEVREDLADAVPAFANALRVFHLGVSWGGYESLVYPAAIGYSSPGATNSVRDFVVPRTLVRLHVGLEDVDDLITDLSKGFAALEGGG